MPSMRRTFKSCFAKSARTESEDKWGRLRSHRSRPHLLSQFALSSVQHVWRSSVNATVGAAVCHFPHGLRRRGAHRQVLALHPDGYLSKTVNREQLPAKVREVLGGTKSACIAALPISYFLIQRCRPQRCRWKRENSTETGNIIGPRLVKKSISGHFAKGIRTVRGPAYAVECELVGKAGSAECNIRKFICKLLHCFFVDATAVIK